MVGRDTPRVPWDWIQDLASQGAPEVLGAFLPPHFLDWCVEQDWVGRVISSVIGLSTLLLWYRHTLTQLLQKQLVANERPYIGCKGMRHRTRNMSCVGVITALQSTGLPATLPAASAPADNYPQLHRHLCSLLDLFPEQILAIKAEDLDGWQVVQRNNAPRQVESMSPVLPVIAWCASTLFKNCSSTLKMYPVQAILGRQDVVKTGHCQLTSSSREHMNMLQISVQ